MKNCKITVDVYFSSSDTPTAYRVYVDSDLLNERDFTWNHDERYFREHVFVHLPPGRHSIRLKSLSATTTLDVKNVIVNDVPSSTDFVVQ